MLKLTINNRNIDIEPGQTLLQACEEADVEIPRFCYHDRLSIAGNCRMCLVELERSPKLVASCALPAADGMVVRTDTPAVRAARRGVMEFLLINHPLDCPICDQGGECDLQDQAMGYGLDHNRFAENKRAVTDKDIGPLVKTTMTRCIHCTRCVRFLAEIAGTGEMGAIGRGEDMEIATYLENNLVSELSGNIIDLCPVGALTARPSAFRARSWELTRTESIDVTDAVGSALRIDSRDNRIMRIVPRNDDDVNEEWLSDKARFAWDGLRRQRLDRPYRRIDGQLRACSWGEALSLLAGRIKDSCGERMAALSGDLAAAEEVMALGDLLDGLKVAHRDCRQDGARLSREGGRAGYLLNTTIAGIEAADAVLLIGTDPRREAILIETRLRKAWRARGLPIAALGAPTERLYGCADLGDDVCLLEDLIRGDHPFAEALAAATQPMLMIGMAALSRPDAAAIMAAALRLAEATGMMAGEWNGFNILHHAAGRVAALDLDFLPRPEGFDRDGILAAASSGDLDLIWLLGADEVPMDRLGETFVVYQGSHGDRGAARADLILPGAAFSEKDGLYVTTEGRVRETRKAVFPPGEAREDWTIIRALADHLDVTLRYDSAAMLRAALYERNPSWGEIDAAPQPQSCEGLHRLASTDLALSDRPLTHALDSFYSTDPISRAAPLMHQCRMIQEKARASEASM